MPAASPLTPNSFFFTDPAAVTQSADQAYGPVSEDQFRLTSKFSLAADTNAYAICTGVVLVQPQAANANLVNLILRPFKQPITGFNIKYFIYRGLNIGDFFDGSNIIAAGTDNSDFINKINASFTAYYASTGGAAPAFLSSFIGFDPTNQPVNTLISDLFYKVTTYTTGTTSTETAQTTFELPVINAGASLGTFATGECGIDVVIDYGDYKLPTPNDQFVFDLAYARATEKIIDLTSISDDFQQKLLKEQIFQFLDVAAYYGFHTANGTVMINSDGTMLKKTGADIYTSAVQNFSTKNTFYLYIQSDRTRSYNFYDNYNISDDDDNCLKMGFSADTLTERTYDTNGWPLIITNVPQNTSDSNNIMYLQFVTDNNDNTVLYGQVANIFNDQGNNFSGPDDMQLPPDGEGNDSNFSKVFQLSNPNTGASGSKSYVATFNILIYQGATYDYITAQTDDGSGNTVNNTTQPNFFDDVFDLLNAIPLLLSGEDTQHSTLSSKRVKLLNHYYNDTEYGISAVQTTINNDVIITGDSATPTLNRVTYASDSVSILNTVTAVSGTATADTTSSPSVAGSVTGDESYQLPVPFYYDLQSFTDNGQLINGLLLKATDDSIPNKVIFGLTQAENNLLKSLIVANNLTNSRLSLVNLFTTDYNLISTENIVYKKYQVAITGETATSQLKLTLNDAPDIIYTIDTKCFFTKGYSDYIKYLPVSSLYLDLEISF